MVVPLIERVISITCVEGCHRGSDENAQLLFWAVSHSESVRVARQHANPCKPMQSRATRSCGLVEARPVIPSAANAELGVRCVRYQTCARYVVANGVLTGGEGNSKHRVATGWSV